MTKEKDEYIHEKFSFHYEGEEKVYTSVCFKDRVRFSDKDNPPTCPKCKAGVEILLRTGGN